MAISWRLTITAALFALICLTGCGVLNKGSSVIPERGPVIGDVQFTANFWGEGETATITVPWTEGTGPFTISIEVGTGESVPPGTDAGTSPFSWEFSLEEGTNFTYTVIMTDSNGYSTTKTGTYGPVSGGPYPDPPYVENVEFDPDTCQLSVEVSDSSHDYAQITVTDIQGLIVDSNTRTIPSGNGTAVFQWSAEDVFEGGSGITEVSATNSYNWYDYYPTEVEITIPPIELDLTEGQLGVIPTQANTTVGDTVTVVVATGAFPATAPFAYMNGMAVTVTDGGDYVDGTFNVGEIGGAFRDVDGIWAEMDPSPMTFFVPEDFMMRATDLAADSSFDFMGFNITPIGAGEVTCGGFLFNFGMSFNAAGTYELGILEFQDVKRTYYSDEAGTEYNWDDIDNDLSVATTISVS